jgi:hypothetical protein
MWRIFQKDDLIALRKKEKERNEARLQDLTTDDLMRHRGAGPAP